MVSKYLIGAALLLAGVIAEEHKFKGEEKKADFEAALMKKDNGYETVKEIKNDVEWKTVLETYSCCKNHPYLLKIKDGDKTHLTCTKTEIKEKDIITTDSWKLNGEDVKVKEIKETEHTCEKATHQHDGEKFGKLLLAFKESKKELKEVEENQTMCAIGTPKEVKKEDKKDDKKEEKIQYDWTYTIVGEKGHKIGEDMATVEIFGKTYLAFCGPKKDIDEKVLKYKTEDGSCCSCAWYVWVIVAVVIVGAGVGAYFVLKEDKEEDEYEAEYGTA